MMHDQSGAVVYIGKAKDLRRRVGSYSTPSAAKDKKVGKLVAMVESISFIETSSEIEALLVESRLIKDRHPIFNRQLVRPESCCFLRHDATDAIPRIEIVGARSEDDARYLGPFWELKSVKDAVELVNIMFHLPQCPAGRKTRDRRTCVYGELGRCLRPCAGGGYAAHHRLRLQAAWNSLSGESDEGVALIESRRDLLVDQYRFEEAYAVHQQWKALSRVSLCAARKPLPSGSFALLVPSYIERRPMLLIFDGKRLCDKLMAAPIRYPEASMLAKRIEKSRRSRKDLLPGQGSGDDLMIVSSYLRRHPGRTSLFPLPPEAPSDTLASALVEHIERLRVPDRGTGSV